VYLLDTDIVIYALKGNAKVAEHLSLNRDKPMAISVISYGELVYGAYKSQYVENNLAKIHRLREIFPIIDITPAISECFGAKKAILKQSGKSVADFDLLIGATAITLGYTLVSNNEKHFKKIPGLNLRNWAR